MNLQKIRSEENERIKKIKQDEKELEKQKNLLERKKRKNSKPKEVYDAIKLIRSIIFSTLARKKCTRLSDKSNKVKEAEKILGCTFEEFKIYIEQHFEKWMCWNNHGMYTGAPKQTWHFDHHIPLSSAKTVEDVIKLNHYSNLKPLDSYINCNIKKAKLSGEFENFTWGK